MKNEKGITLMALIIMIIVLMILLSITMTASFKNKDEVREEILEAELEQVQHAILERKTKADLTGTLYTELPGEDINDVNEVNAIVKGKVTLKGSAYKRLNKAEFEKLGISNIEDTYIVCYETGEVINETKFNKSEKTLYIYATETPETETP